VDDDDVIGIPLDDGALEDEEQEDDVPVIVVVDPNANYSVHQQHVALGTWADEADNKEHGRLGTNAQEAPKRQKHQKRRDRHDSEDDDESKEEVLSGTRRRRPESESNEGSGDVPTTRRDLDDGAPQSRRRRRHDSDASSSSEEPLPAMRRRHDSEDDSSNGGVEKRKKRRYDSSSEAEEEKKPRRQRYDSSSSVSSSNSGSDGKAASKERMSSGHVAGIQNASDFSKKHARIQQKRHKEALQMVNKYGVGETVYRDGETGKKVTTDDTTAITAQRQLDSQRKTRKPLSAEEQRLLNTGRAQLERQEQQKREFAVLQESTFARHKDDVELKDWRKKEIRADDPMAAYAATKRTAAAGGSSSKQQRPVYKGPPPKPNRYGIPPGHRWDANDRGNGFEDKLLEQRFSAQHQKEKAYRYSSADM
jgi:pre-mRNA-splicing factor CWC26